MLEGDGHLGHTTDDLKPDMDNALMVRHSGDSEEQKIHIEGDDVYAQRC